MKIGIDISQIVHKTGVSNYILNLVSSLLKTDKNNEYILFGSSLRLRSILDNYYLPTGKYLKKIYPLPPLILELLWNQLHLFPIERFIGKVNLFHTSDWLEPPSLCPKITTIHDLAIFKYPETFAPKGMHDIVKNQKRRLELVKREARLIIAVSENTKKDIIELLGIAGERIRVIYEGIGEEFYPRQKNEITEIKKKYQISGDYILAAGTREPRKNLGRLIQAMSSLTGVAPVKGLPLVIAGKFGWGEDIQNVKCLGLIPKEDLASLYSGALCFVYPSLYEGFGLPILEAMKCGCPVVTSNVSSMPEVAGKAAVLVNPLETEDIARGIEEAIERREEMVKRGFERMKLFSWEKCAKETLEVYHEFRT